MAKRADPRNAPDAEPSRASVEGPGAANKPNDQAPRALGSVDVATRSGWAAVYRNGRYAGQTPVRLNLPVGRHALTLRSQGTGPPVTLRVRVRTDRVERVVVEL
jgi:hypothetical protein